MGNLKIIWITNNAGKQSGESGYVSITGVTDKNAIKASSKYKATATMTNGIITAINIEDPEAAQSVPGTKV